MWRCAKCGERIEESFDNCWNCGTSKDGVEDPEFLAEPPEDYEPDPTVLEKVLGTLKEEKEEEVRDTDPMVCARCFRRLEYAGTKRFHEGAKWALLGELGDFFVNRESFDVYFCPRCGKTEFFVDGIGEQFRPR